MNFLLELGVEEIPAGFLPNGRAALRAAAEAALTSAGLAAGDAINVYGSPRRLAVLITNLPERSEDAVELHKGPPARVAFDADGAPTKAAEGFAKKIGISPTELERDGDYIVGRKKVAGRDLHEIVAAAVPRIIESIPWPKSMRWNATGKRFVRAIRWIVALVDEKIVATEWAGIAASRTTYVRRMRAEGIAVPVEIPSATAYLDSLRAHGIIVDHTERAAMVEKRAVELAASIGAEPVMMDGAGTFPYLADHVEDPEIMLGEFDADFTMAPREVLELTMWRHQKYVPLLKDDTLLPKFLITSNRTFGPASDDLRNAARKKNVIAGNRRVLSARLSDAKYFWETDITIPLCDRVRALEKVTFQKDAGSVLDRVKRIEATAVELAKQMKIADEAPVRRAAMLAKADLTTKMVFEFPELQGVIGRRIAEHQGESAEVAAAIEEHYWPLGADPRVPKRLSAVIALAEKADTLASIFGVGLEPTGSADPYGLRRAAIGIIRIILETGSSFDLTKLIKNEKVLTFIRQRMLNYVAEQHAINASVLEAVAASGWTDPVDFLKRAKAASKLKDRADFEDMAVSFKRVMNILDSDEGKDVAADPAKLFEAAEKKLFDETAALDAEVASRLASDDVDEALSAMARVRPSVDAFFNEVLVNADDSSLRINRKALLRRLGSIFLRVMDFSRL